MYLNFIVLCILSLIVNAAQAIEDNSEIVIDKVCADKSDISINFPLELKSDIKISGSSCIIFPINFGNEEVLEFAFEVHKESDNSEVDIYVYENEMEEPVVTNKFNLSANYEEPFLDKVILELKNPIVGYITVRGNSHNNNEVALKSVKFLTQFSDVDIQTPIDTKFQKYENAKDGNNDTIDKDIRELDDYIFVKLLDDDDHTTTETDAGFTTENSTGKDTTEEANEETTKAEDTSPEQQVERPEYKIPVGLFGIILISIGCLTILALASLGSYQLGKIRSRKDLSGSAVKDFTILEDPEVPRIIPRVNNVYSEPPFGRMRPV